MRSGHTGSDILALNPGFGPPLVPALPPSVRCFLAVMAACLWPRCHADALGRLSRGCRVLAGTVGLNLILRQLPGADALR